MATRSRNLKEQAADARKELIKKYALQELVEKGYMHASLNEVCRLSGGSKATIVKYFGNKAGLFSVILIHVAQEFSKALEFESLSARDADLPDVVERLARRLLEFYLAPEAVALYRGVIGSGHSDLALSEGFYTGGHMVIVKAIARLLARWVGKGIAEDCDLESWADRFTHIVRAGLYERYLLGLTAEAPSPQDIAQAAQEAADLFIRALRPG